jgi:hypothetical protein
MPDDAICLVDSATALKDQARGRVVVAGSQGSPLPANLVAIAGARACVLHDAGIGKDEAGVSALPYCEGFGMAAATVDYKSARISDSKDMMARGVVSRVNALAAALGAKPGMTCAEVAALLTRAAMPTSVPAKLSEDAGRWLAKTGSGGMKVWALDSNALMRDDDIGQIVLTGSHGGLVGGKPESALRVRAHAAVFNDAGICPDGSSTSRLPVLDDWGIAAATVSAASARISDGRSTYNDGILSLVNARAQAVGARVGMSAREFCDLVLAAAHQK